MTKLLLVVYGGDTPHRVTDLLDRHVRGWTELTGAHGAGASGRREGTRAWPGGSAVFFSVADASEADALAASLRREAASLPDGERLHAAVLPVETFF